VLIYIAHAYSNDKSNIEKAKKITHDLQVKDLANCYICPLLTFSHLEYGEIGYDDEIELCLDVLQNCEKLIVASEISKGVQMEIDFAKLVKMEVMRIDENGELQPFAE
jgi:ketopantoate reductase